jgi:hypothetical protein
MRKQPRFYNFDTPKSNRGSVSSALSSLRISDAFSAALR